MHKRRAAVAVGLVLALSTRAQSPETIKIRLAPVAVDTPMKATITGSGSVTAALAGSKLTVNGTFEGMQSPATAAHIHQGSAPGVRGGPLLTLTVTKAASGTVSGSFDLTPEQIESFKKGRWYVQIHAEKAPDGNLWGWLMRETR